MEFPDSRHDLLPWYATGKLNIREAEEFRDHLGSCPACREELAFLETVKAGTDEYGEEFFKDHPSTEQLVGAVMDQLAEDDTREIRRHLALCATCAAEASWVRGEAVAGAQPSSAEPLQFRPRPTRWVQWAGWATAAAASTLLALVVWQGPEFPEEPVLFDSRVLVPAERADAGTPRFVLGERWPQPLVEVDFPRDAFPVVVEVSRGTDGVVFREDGIERSRLIGGLYYSYSCLADCSPGRYTIRVISSDPAEPASTFEFEVEAGSR